MAVFCYAAIEPWLTTVFMHNPQWRFPLRRLNELEEKRSDHTSSPSVGSGDDTRPPFNRQRIKPKGMRRPSRRVWEGLTYVAPLQLLDLTMIKKFSDVPLEDKLVSGNYAARFAHQSHHSGHFLLPSLHNFKQSSPLQTTRALPASAPSSRRLALELITSFVIYDATFFLFHIVLHIAPGLKAWHTSHHKHAEIHPQITNQLSIFERLGLALLANFKSQHNRRASTLTLNAIERGWRNDRPLDGDASYFRSPARLSTLHQVLIMVATWLLLSIEVHVK